MSTPSLHSRENLRKALFLLPHGMPVTARHMAQWDISRQLAHKYTKSGWLVALGGGYFLRAGDTLTMTGAVAALEANRVSVHLAGKSALALRGYEHYVALGKGSVYLYGRGSTRLPSWFVSQFNVQLSTRRLFKGDDQAQQLFFVRKLEPDQESSPLVSDPERAVLEMLDDVPLKQSVEEAKQVMEAMFSLDAGKLQLLLQACAKVKVKRLFWLLAQELGLPVLNQIDPSSIDFGADAPYTIPGEKSMTLKNPMKGQHG